MNSVDAGSGDRLPLIRHLLFDCEKHQSETCLARCFSDTLFLVILGFRVMMRQLLDWELAFFMPFRGNSPKRTAADRVRAEPEQGEAPNAQPYQPEKTIPPWMKNRRGSVSGPYDLGYCLAGTEPRSQAAQTNHTDA